MSRISHGFKIVPVLKFLLALSGALMSTYVASGRFMFVATGPSQQQQVISTGKVPADFPAPATKKTSSKKTNRSVALGADRTQVALNEPVHFTVSIKGFRGVIQGGCRFSYLLFFGDGRSQTALMTCDKNKKFQHAYDKEGKYVARVVNFSTDCSGTITPANEVIVNVGKPTPSPTQTVSSSPGPTVTVATSSPTPTVSTPTQESSPTVTVQSPSPPESNSPTPLHSPSPRPTDTSSPSRGAVAVVSPSRSPTSTEPAYSSPGQSIENAAVLPSPTASPSLPPSVTGAGDVGTNWWKYLLVILVVILVSFAAYRARRGGSGPRLTISSHLDDGVANSIAKSGSKNLTIDVELRLNPGLARSQFHINTREANLIRSERRDDG